MRYDLVLVDANNACRRMAHAHADLSIKINGKEHFTGVAYGVLRMLERLRREYGKEVVFVWDAGRALRVKIDPNYKGNRRRDPVVEAGYQAQVHELKRAFKFLGVPQAYAKGHEADDVIHTLSRSAAEKKQSVLIVSNDYDYMQSLAARVHVCRFKDGQETIYTPDVFKSEFKVTPLQWKDVLSLCGDATDNVPGVPGIGEKSALEIVAADSNFVPTLLNGSGEDAIANFPSTVKKRLYNLAKKAAVEADDKGVPYRNRAITARKLVYFRRLPDNVIVKVKETPQIRMFRMFCSQFSFRSILEDSEIWENLTGTVAT